MLRAFGFTANMSPVETHQIKVRLGLLKRTVIPVWTLDSGQPGPFLLLVAAQHGNEVQGSEIIRRFVDVSQQELAKGGFAAVPFANPPAILERKPHIRMGPEQDYGDDRGFNMNRCWPGKPDGNPMERIAHAIYASFGRDATHAIDIHCWQKHAAPGILLHPLPGMRDLAAGLGARFIHIRPFNPATLAGYFGSTRRIGITYECSGQYTLNESSILDGLRVTLNFARTIGILSGDPEPAPAPPLFSDKFREITIDAPASGLFRAESITPGAEVSRRQILGHILSDKTLQSIPVTSPADGVLQCLGVSRPKCDVAIHGHHPCVSKGDKIAAVWTPTRT